MSILGLLCLLLCSGAVLADEQSSGDKPAPQSSNQQHTSGDSFKSEVMPVLKRYCIKCHGVSKKEASLQLHSSVRIFQGGESFIDPLQAFQYFRFEMCQVFFDSPVEFYWFYLCYINCTILIL